MTKCVDNGQLHFVDCFTQLLVTNTTDHKDSVDTSAPLKSYSLDQRLVCVSIGGLEGRQGGICLNCMFSKSTMTPFLNVVVIHANALFRHSLIITLKFLLIHI